jgi:predicted alpha/beta superfamily hydrolase
MEMSRIVFGHSMGGHGALIAYLKNPGMFEVSRMAQDPLSWNFVWLTKSFLNMLS